MRECEAAQLLAPHAAIAGQTCRSAAIGEFFWCIVKPRFMLLPGELAPDWGSSLALARIRGRLMKTVTTFNFLAIQTLILATALAAPSLAEPAAGQANPTASFATLEAAENAANAQPGPRNVPARSIPVPGTVSPEVLALIAAPYRVPAWDANPKSPEEWKELVATLAARGAAAQPRIREKLGVTMQPAVIGGVKSFILAPTVIPDANRNRLLVHVHGGGYVYNPGEAGTGEAALMAAYGGFKVISFDYRMPPDAPYPAAMDDAMAVWKAALQMQEPRNMAIFGTSTGGGMTLAMILRAKQEHLPLPAAIAPGTPWSDLTETGDTYKTNEWLDNVLVSYNGYLSHAAKLYANGHDLKDPQLSPIYGDFHGFPPAILTSGTRDLFLSNTVLTHRKLRQAGVEAVLQVFEGLSHAQYLFDPNAPETKEAFTEIAQFFDAHLGR
jgi:epsilon-lactone hydrolase